ncbi:hypothetical protein C817_03496 [Dorea sp. 5-2]|nr:hypothetical protein C817_03496 [Dorea sp. 5-2]
MIMGFTEASRMFRDVWSLYRRYAARRLDEAGMDEVRDCVSVVYEKYKAPFAKEILLAVVGEIERTARFYDRKEKGERGCG